MHFDIDCCCDYRGPETYRRGMNEREAKNLAKGMNKKKRDPWTYRAERVGQTWDVVRWT